MKRRAACVAAASASLCSMLPACAADRSRSRSTPDAAAAAFGGRTPADAADRGALASDAAAVHPSRDANAPADVPSDSAVQVPEASTRMDASIPAACAGDAAALPSGARCILHIDGRAIDENGAPIAPHTLASACGPEQCAPGYTASDGSFAIPVGVHLDPSLYSVELHVRPDQAAFYFALPKNAPGPIVDMGALRVLPMPPHGPLLDVNPNGAAAQTVASGDVTLDVPEGVYVRLDVESNLAGDHGREFRALTIASRFIDEFADGIAGLRAVYALEPFESSFEYPGAHPMPALVRLSFVNTAAIAAGAAVDVLALGTYVYPEWVTPAALEKVASAHVSADGSRIELDPGEGLPHLTWIALRPS
ncbi:MAG TPA: hypothetical protein VHC69_18195 [Polyangiaceae bacterium]|nr:hypothetical protein [Polyangiaceae bacterium]